MVKKTLVIMAVTTFVNWGIIAIVFPYAISEYDEYRSFRSQLMIIYTEEDSDPYICLNNAIAARNLKPENSSAYLMLGRCYIDLCEFDKAIENFNTAKDKIEHNQPNDQAAIKNADLIIEESVNKNNLLNALTRCEERLDKVKEDFPPEEIK